jgi:hypothetical protein
MAIGALTGWFAIMFQLFLIVENRELSVLATVIQFFSYFTILTNILAALCCTILLRSSEGRSYSFFSRSTTLTATAVYIAVVGLTYNFVLRQLWAPQGLQRIVDELLHLVCPLLFLGFWALFVPKRELQWSAVWPWLWYPFIYLVYVLIRGALSGLYPYPFIDVNVLGYPQVLIHSVFVTLAFLGFAFLFVAIGKAGNRASTK